MSVLLKALFRSLSWCNEKRDNGDGYDPTCNWYWDYELIAISQYVDKAAGRLIPCSCGATHTHTDDSKKDEREYTERWPVNFYIEIYAGYDVMVILNNQTPEGYHGLWFTGNLTRRLDDEDEWELDFSNAPYDY